MSQEAARKWRGQVIPGTKVCAVQTWRAWKSEGFRKELGWLELPRLVDHWITNGLRQAMTHRRVSREVIHWSQEISPIAIYRNLSTSWEGVVAGPLILLNSASWHGCSGPGVLKNFSFVPERNLSASDRHWMADPWVLLAKKKGEPVNRLTMEEARFRVFVSWWLTMTNNVTLLNHA